MSLQVSKQRREENKLSPALFGPPVRLSTHGCLKIEEEEEDEIVVKMAPFVHIE